MPTQLEDKFGLPESIIRLYGLQILGALRFLHSRGIVYGDLKSSNVLVDSSGKVKLADLFSTSAFDGELTGMQAPRRNEDEIILGIMGPEVFDGYATRKSDVFSFGRLLLEMLNGGNYFWTILNCS